MSKSIKQQLPMLPIILFKYYFWHSLYNCNMSYLYLYHYNLSCVISIIYMALLCDWKVA